MDIKSIGSGLKNNWKGLLLGAAAGYFGAKKLGKVEKKSILIGAAIGGALLGSFVEYKIKGRTVKPAVASGLTSPKKSKADGDY
ncbi:MAG: hypothetical protein V4547_17810 [Bacteroidota bacterium]